MKHAWEGIVGEHVVRLAGVQAPPDYLPGRLCIMCSGPLTRYNPGPACYAHTERKPMSMRIARAKGSRVSA